MANLTTTTAGDNLVDELSQILVDDAPSGFNVGLSESLTAIDALGASSAVAPSPPLLPQACL
jgi:hypothetical protein